mmetsp:Transcript_2284/g.3496  ORF Transcript_2284/g.3496 Transcript_2284/m.3496 type:complete len:474 (+) Transcript_2284:98-1519(+)
MVTSNAAVAELTVPTPVLQSDNLLSFILNLLPSHQVKLSTPKKGTSMTLSVDSNKTSFTSRNAILRTLSSLSLLNRLDKNPFLLLGGYSEGEKSSSEAAMVLASISSYMSIASMIRSNDEKEAHILTSLNEILAMNSFLVGNTSRPTLADYDVFYALAERNELTFKEDVITKDMTNLRRWILAVQASVEELVNYQASVAIQKGVDAKIPFVEFGILDPVPAFFYGEDDGAMAASADLSSAPASAKAKAAPGASKAAPGADAAGGKNELTDEEKKAVAEKRAKKAAEKKGKKGDSKAGGSEAAPAGGDFNVSALDIRVGKIIDVWEHEASEKLWCEKVDLGEDEPRQILSGLRAFYKKEEMKDRHVLVLCNLKKRNLVGVPSHGMVMCATNADHTAVEFVIPPEGVKIGERVTFEGLTGEPEPENKVAKKKIFEKLAPDLKTDDNGVVVWKGIKSVTSAGPCVASKGMKGAQVS